jgi:predicted GIY-YIG superfamily endonuclease
MHKPKELVYVEEFSSRAEAMKKEKRIKKLNHVQKLRLAKRQVKPERNSKKRAC